MLSCVHFRNIDLAKVGTNFRGEIFPKDKVEYSPDPLNITMLAPLFIKPQALRSYDTLTQPAF